MRIGVLTHLLIEDLDLDSGWLMVRNKTELGWRIKTGHERVVPLVPELVTVLRVAIGNRAAGPVFLRQKLVGKTPKLSGDRRSMEKALKVWVDAARTECSSQGRSALQSLAKKVWLDAGLVKNDAVRISFVRIMKAIGHPEATCPKSWRHSFATLLQDANVDPLIRQQTLGHKPTSGTGLGMTGNYTHTRPETQKQQIEAAIRQWPETLQHAIQRTTAK
jgi:integrase